MKDKYGKEKSSMSTTEVGVLIEDLKSNFRTFGEGLTMLREKIDSVANALANTMERITTIESRLTRLENKR